MRNRRQPEYNELATTISDQMHGQGVGKLLPKQSSRCARELGVHHLEASVLPQIERMTKLLQHSGLALD